MAIRTSSAAWARTSAWTAISGRGWSIRCRTLHVGHGLDGVDDVVHPDRQTVDVLAVERGDERGVQRSNDLVGDLVTLVLPLQDLGVGTFGIPVVGHELEEQAGGVGQVGGGLLEQVEEALPTGITRNFTALPSTSPDRALDDSGSITWR